MGDGEGEELWMGGYAWPPAARAPARGSIKGGQTVAAKCRHRRKLTWMRGCVHAQALVPPAQKISFLQKRLIWFIMIQEEIYDF